MANEADFTVTVSAANTPVQFPQQSIDATVVLTIKADRDNSVPVYLGWTNSPTFPLYPGDSIDVVVNVATGTDGLWLNATAGNQKVYVFMSPKDARNL